MATTARACRGCAWRTLTSVILLLSFASSCGSDEIPVANDAVDQISQLIEGDQVFGTAMDAALSPDADVVYFTALDLDGSGVWRVAASGGKPERLAGGRLGEPWFLALGIDVSPDGEVLFVADPGSGIYAMPIVGSVPALLRGTEDVAPYSVTVARSGDLYFSGWFDGTPGVGRISAEGGSAVIIAQGEPLVEPTGVAVSSDGTVYVVDRAEGTGATSRVIRIDAAGSVEAIVDDFRSSSKHAGVALTLDESVLLVSAVDRDGPSARVLVVDLGSLEYSVVDRVISANVNALGLHRAMNRDAYAWANGPDDADLDIFIATTSEDGAGNVEDLPQPQPSDLVGTGSVYFITLP